MNSHELANKLKARYPHMSDDVLSRTLRGACDIRHPGDRSGSSHEKFKDAVPRKAHHKPKETKMDEGGGYVYSVSIKLMYGDKRRRDADGAVTTILDCLVAARRLLDSDPELKRRVLSGRTRSGLDRSQNNH